MISLRGLFLAIGMLAVASHADGAEPSRPLIVAHRGLLLHAPENTLANFRACLELRLGFEFDVARTKDGQLVCIHDDEVDRTTNGAGKVSDLALEEIRRLDAGSWFAPEFAGEKVPTIEEVLKLLEEHPSDGILFAADLKAEGVEEEVVRLAERHRVLDRVLFIGRTITEPEVRARLRRASPDAHAAAVANDENEFAAALAAPDADWVYFRYLPTAEQMEQVRRAGKRTFIAGKTVSGNVPGNWRHCAGLGIDGVLTDYPLELRQRLRDTRSTP